MLLNRGVTALPLTIASGAALTEAFDMSIHAGAVLFTPGTWTAANIGFKVSSAYAGTYAPLYDEDGAIVEVAATASKAFSLPAELFGCSWVKLWSQDGSGNDTNQAAERSLTLLLKS